MWQAFSFGLVSAERKTESQKVKEGEEGRGRKETPADKPLDFENLRSPANAAPVWLGWSNNVDMCRSKVCFIL